MKFKQRLKALEQAGQSGQSLNDLYQAGLTGTPSQKLEYLSETKHAAAHHERRVEMLKQLAMQLPD